MYKNAQFNKNLIKKKIIPIIWTLKTHSSKFPKASDALYLIRVTPIGNLCGDLISAGVCVSEISSLPLIELSMIVGGDQEISL